MASTHKRKRGRDDGPSALDADIQVLNHAMTACDISQARDAFSSGGALLTTIRVRPLLFRSGGLWAHVHAGLHGQRTGARGSWAVLC